MPHREPHLAASPQRPGESDLLGLGISGLRASDNGVYPVVADLDLRISVDGLVTRIMEASPRAIKRAGARLAGQTTSAAKATASARNGRLGGRPKAKAKTAAWHG
jgi:hypothetical protein